MWAETSHIEQNTQLHIWQNTNHENSDIILISSRRIELLHICIKSNISQLCHTARQTHAHNHLCSCYQNKFKAAAQKKVNLKHHTVKCLFQETTECCWWSYSRWFIKAQMETEGWSILQYFSTQKWIGLLLFSNGALN